MLKSQDVKIMPDKSSSKKFLAGAFHVALYTSIAGLVEMVHEMLTLILLYEASMPPKTTSVRPSLRNSLGGLVVLLQMTAKSGCRKQSGPMPKGNSIIRSPHLFGQLADGVCLSLMPCLFLGASKLDGRHANGVVAVILLLLQASSRSS